MLNRLRLDFSARRKSKTPKPSDITISSVQEVPLVLSISPGTCPSATFPRGCPSEKEVISTTEVLLTPEPIITLVPPIPLQATRFAKMSVPPSPTSSSLDTPLSIFVLLPSAAHMQAQQGPIAPISRPPPLATRQSGSSVVTLDTLRIAEQQQHPLAKETKGQVSPDLTGNRRLSLAPGMGSGTQTRSTRFGDGLRPLSSTNEGSASSAAPPPFGSSYRMSSNLSVEAPAAAGSASGSRTGASARSPRRRPNTANAPDPRFQNQGPRGSMALPSGMGLGLSARGSSRPGWEGDEVVGMLRGSGMEVSVIRNTSHLPSVLAPESTSSPTIPSFSSTGHSSAKSGASRLSTPVILVPLGDSPSLPSLSLLMAQGTTPSAVCFQQDVLDRARRTEEEWLPSAIEQIAVVVRMRDHASASGRSEKPIILAYSANPALSASTISSCVDAGASGVLRPPYDLETAQLVRRMVAAAKTGRLSSVVSMAASKTPTSPTFSDASMKVVLPPTALFGGGEHEGERVLTGHRRKMSGTQDIQSLANASRDRSSSRSLAGSRKQSKRDLPSLTISAATEEAGHPDAEMDNLAFALYQPSLQRRRRSVDTGGLATAMKRAQKAFEVAARPVPIPGLAPSTPATPQIRHGRLGSSSRAMTPGPMQEGRGSAQDEADPFSGDVDTHLAELLSAMFYQTCVTIDVQMEQYEEASAPLTSEHRARLMDALATWDFKPHRLSEGDLYRVACLIFEGIMHTEGIVELGLEQDQMNRLLFAIKAIYHAPNPYHNYIHAIDVLQATYNFLIDIGVAPPWSFLRDLTPDTSVWKRPDETVQPVHGLGTRRAREVLRPQDVLAVVIAAMGHDVGHPGLGNAFMTNAKTPLSQVYDDKSVLENMHCMLVVRLLRKHGLGFLLSQSDPSVDLTATSARSSLDSKGFRKVLYSMVLATDMSLHFAWIGRLKEMGNRVDGRRIGLKQGEEGEKEVESDRIMLCQSVLKCADISNPTRPIDTSEHWSTVLLEEWAKQASLETDLSLPVSVIASADQALQAKGQIGFIDLFTQPLFEAFADVVPEIQRYADLCAENRALWSSRMESLKDSNSVPLVQPVIAGASVDDRFQTLFPLSLPVSLVSLSCLEPGPLPPPSTSSAAGQATASYSSMGPQTPNRQTVAALQTPQSTSSFTFGSSPTSSYSPTAKAMRAVYHANLLDQRHRLAKEGKGVPIPGVNVLVDAARRASTPDAIASASENTGSAGMGRFDQQFLRS